MSVPQVAGAGGWHGLDFTRVLQILKATNMTKKRTGATVRHSPSNCPSALAITLGFTPEQAKRMISIRRVLPFTEERSVPHIDARKLWGRIGKPQGKFADWIRRDLKPLTERTGNISQIREILTPTERRPRKDYLLSRDMASFLAVLADTAEGDQIRSYFLDMEQLALKLAEYVPLRVSLIVEHDNAATSYLRRHNGEKVKAGALDRSEAISKATEQEQHLKSMVCEVLTGFPSKAWRDTLGKGVRDALDSTDLAAYATTYSTAVCIMKAGKNRCDVREILLPSFANKIDPSKYGVGLSGF